MLAAGHEIGGEVEDGEEFGAPGFRGAGTGEAGSAEGERPRAEGGLAEALELGAHGSDEGGAVRGIIEVPFIDALLGGAGLDADGMDGHDPAHERLGLREAVGILEQPSEVVEGTGEYGMVLAEGGLVDGEGSAKDRLGLGEAVGVLKQLGEVVEASGDGGMLLTEGGLGNGKSLAVKRLCGGVLGLGFVKEGDLVEEIGGGFGDVAGGGVEGGGAGVGSEGDRHGPGADVVGVVTDIALFSPDPRHLQGQKRSRNSLNCRLLELLG